MEMLVSGKLETATSEPSSFAGYIVEASFGREPPRDGQFAEGNDTTEVPLSVRISTTSDAAGNFTIPFPDRRELCAEIVKFTAWSPNGHIVGESEVMKADLRKLITIKVTSSNAQRRVSTPQGAAVDALFRTDAALRRAITDNLKPLRGESEAVAARVEKAWNFRPSRLSAEELARRHYVAHRSDPSEVQRTVIKSGVEALQSTKTKRGLTLRHTAELKRLIMNQENGDSHGVVELGPLIDFIQRRGAGPIQGAELTSTPYAAEAEAEALLSAIGDKDGAPIANQQNSTATALEAGELVKNTVNKQMESATAPRATRGPGKGVVCEVCRA